MGVNVRRESPIDFILAAFAGGAQGAAKGLESRQARKEREAAAQTQARFKNLQLSLQQQGIDISRLSQESLDKFRDAQIEEKRLLREAAVPPLTFKQQKELKAIGPGDKPLSAKEEILESQKITKGRLGIEKLSQELGFAQAAEDRAERATALAEAGHDLAVDISNFDNQFNVAELAWKMSDATKDRETTIWLQRHKENMASTEGELSDVDRLYIGHGNKALEAAVMTDDKRIIDIATAYSVGIAKIWKQHGKDMPAFKPEFRNRMWPWEDVRKVEQVDIGDVPPKTALPIPALSPPPSSIAGDQAILDGLLPQQPAAPVSQPTFGQTTDDIFAELNQILEQGKRTPTPSAEPQAPEALPFNLPEVRLSKQPQAFEGTEFAAPTTNVESVITSLQNSGKTTISKAFKTSLKDLGFTDAEIKRIEKAIKAE